MVRLQVVGGKLRVTPLARDGNTEQRIRSLHAFRWNRNSSSWQAGYDPALLLELTETLGTSRFLLDPSAEQPYRDACAGEQQRLRNRQLFRERHESGVEDLTGYRFTTQPYGAHQRRALTCLKDSRTAALFLDCGLGKTYTTLMWLRYLKDHKKPNLRVLIVSPAATLRGTWEEDIKKHAADFTYSILNQTVAKAIQALAIPVNLYIINFEKIPRMSEALLKEAFDAIVVDESVRISNPRAGVTKTLLSLADRTPYRLILSGYPAPQGEWQYWSQLRFLSKRALGTSYVKFRDTFFSASGFGGFTYLLKDDYRPLLEDTLKAYAFRARASDFIDLPEQLEKRLVVYLPKKAEEVYLQYLKTAIVELEAIRTSLQGASVVPSDVWLSTTILDQLIRLRQLCGGFLCKGEKVWDESTASIVTARKFSEVHTAKLDALRCLLEEIGPRPVIVWASFIQEFELLKDYLNDYQVRICNGTISRRKKDQAIQWFKDSTDGKYAILLAHPKSVGHGLTFVNCRYNIFYSLDWSVDAFYQAKKRTHRIGQTAPVSYAYLEACLLNGEPTIDALILEKLEGKHSSSMELLDRIIEGTWHE